MAHGDGARSHGIVRGERPAGASPLGATSLGTGRSAEIRIEHRAWPRRGAVRSWSAGRAPRYRQELAGWRGAMEVLAEAAMWRRLSDGGRELGRMNVVTEVEETGAAG